MYFAHWITLGALVLCVLISRIQTQDGLVLTCDDSPTQPRRAIDSACFVVVNQREFFDNANSLCGDGSLGFNGTLAVLDTPLKRKLIKKLLQGKSKAFGDLLWLGLKETTQDNWIWLNGAIQPTSGAAWSGGATDDALSIETVGAFVAKTGLLQDESKSQPFASICQFDLGYQVETESASGCDAMPYDHEEFSNFCFVLINEKTNYDDASKQCGNDVIQGTLAVPDTTDKLKALIGFLAPRKITVVWIGLSQTNQSDEPSGSWMWASKVSANVVPWADGEPNNVNGLEHMATLNVAQGKMYDFPASKPLVSVCEFIDIAIRVKEYSFSAMNERLPESAAVAPTVSLPPTDTDDNSIIMGPPNRMKNLLANSSKATDKTTVNFEKPGLIAPNAPTEPVDAPIASSLDGGSNQSINVNCSMCASVNKSCKSNCNYLLNAFVFVVAGIIIFVLVCGIAYQKAALGTLSRSINSARRNVVSFNLSHLSNNNHQHANNNPSNNENEVHYPPDSDRQSLSNVPSYPSLSSTSGPSNTNRSFQLPKSITRYTMIHAETDEDIDAAFQRAREQVRDIQF